MKNYKRYFYKIVLVYLVFIFSLLLLHSFHAILIGNLSAKYNWLILCFGYVFILAIIFLVNHLWINQKIYWISKMEEQSSSYILLIFVSIYFIFIIYHLVFDDWINKFNLKFFEISIGSGIIEEYIFRGIILILCLKMFLLIFPQKFYMDILLSILISSFLFSLLHIINIITLHQNINATIVQMLFTIVMGIVNSVVYLKTRSIIIPMIMHFTWDFCSSLGITYVITTNWILHNSFVVYIAMLFLILTFMLIVINKSNSLKIILNLKE